MTTAADRWELRKGEYLRQVAEALATVRHPRCQDVLEEVRSHLEERFSSLTADQRTPENLEGILTDMGPPEEYAELLAEGPVALPREPEVKTSRRVWMVYGAIFIVSAFLAFGAAYEFKDWSKWFVPLFLPFLIGAFAVKMIVYGLFGLYRGLRRTLSYYLRIFVANYLATFLIVLGFFYFSHFDVERWFPTERFLQVIFTLDWGFTLFLTWGLTRGWGEREKSGQGRRTL